LDPLAFGGLGWLIENGYRVSKRQEVAPAATAIPQAAPKEPKANPATSDNPIDNAHPVAARPKAPESTSSKGAVPKPASSDSGIHVEQHSSGPDSPNVATFGPNSPITLNRKPNPYASVAWYEFNGVKHTQEGNKFTAIAGEEMGVFQKLVELQKQQDWPTLRDVCEERIKKSPEWLTPYLFAGVAYAHLGDREQAVKRLEYVDKQAAGNSEYSDAGRLLEVLRK
jgi:hypothetical protein